MATVHLVRHAKAGDRTRWEGDDALRPLSPAGLAQARALVEVLREAPVDGVRSSPAVRCRQTVEPLAEARGLAVEDCEALAEGGGLAEALAVVVSGADLVLCSHGDVIGLVLDHLVHLRVLHHRDLVCEKGSGWALEVRGGRVRGARYIPPP